MIWWASTVLGGYEPLSLIDRLAQRLGIYGSGRWFDCSETTYHAVKNYGADKYLDFIVNSAPYSPLVAAQVVALFHLAAGVPMHPEVRTLALQACRHGHLGFPCSFERRRHLEELARMINTFDASRPEPLRKWQLEKMLGLG